MVSVGMSMHALPWACGASPVHRRMVWTPRKALLSPAVAQGDLSAAADVHTSTHQANIAISRFMGCSFAFREDYTSGNDAFRAGYSIDFPCLEPNTMCSQKWSRP